jgi:hypothetical protein
MLTRVSADPVPSGHRGSASPYAAVGGDDDDLAAHAAEVRRSRLELSPTVAEAHFWLDHDPGGALLGVTEAPGGDAAVPGVLGRAVTQVLPLGFLRDPESVWRSCLLADVPGRALDVTAQLSARLVDLAHSARAFVRHRPVRLRLSLLATSVRGVPGRAPAPAVTSPARAGGTTGSPGSPGTTGSPAEAVLTGVVRAVESRSSTRTRRSFAVLTVETAGFTLDVCVAPGAVEGELPGVGAAVEATGELTATFAGGPAELDQEGGENLAEQSGLFVSTPPLTLRRLPGASAWPAPLPFVDLGQSEEVLAPLVTSSGATDAGIVASCVDFDGRWQLRRFPHGSGAADRVWDLPGHPEACVVHRGGVAVLVGRQLSVLDAEFRLLQQASIPGAGTVHLGASPAAVHVVVAERATEADVPDEQGRAALRAGETVHRYTLHRLGLDGPPGTTGWQSLGLPFSVLYRFYDPAAPVWQGAGPADTTGAGLWFAVPGVDGWGRVAQHSVEVDAAGQLALRTDVDGPPWTTARLWHGAHLLTGSSAGPAVNGMPLEQPGPVSTRWLGGRVPAAVVTALDGRLTRVLEWLPADGRGAVQPVAELAGNAFVSRAEDPATGRRWYVLADWAGSSVLGVVDADGAPLRPTHQLAGHPHLVDVRAGTAVLSHTMASSPVLDPRTGRLLPPQQMATDATYMFLSTLVRLPAGER